MKWMPIIAPNQHQSTKRYIHYSLKKSQISYINNVKIMQLVFNCTTPFIHNFPAATKATVSSLTMANISITFMPIGQTFHKWRSNFKMRLVTYLPKLGRDCKWQYIHINTIVTIFNSHFWSKPRLASWPLIQSSLFWAFSQDIPKSFMVLWDVPHQVLWQYFKEFWSRQFYRMPFLSPNQQYQTLKAQQHNRTDLHHIVSSNKQLQSRISISIITTFLFLIN